MDLKLDGSDSSSSNDRFRAFQALLKFDLNGSELSNTGGSRGPIGLAGGQDIFNSSSDNAVIGSMSAIQSYNWITNDNSGGGDIDITNAYGLKIYSPVEVQGIGGTATNVYGSHIGMPQSYSNSNYTVTNFYGYYLNDHGYNETTFTNTCLLYTSPSPRDLSTSRMPSSA